MFNAITVGPLVVALTTPQVSASPVADPEIVVADQAQKASELDAAAIVRKAMARNLLGLAGTAHANMVIHTARGETKNRDLDVRLMRNSAGLQRALLTFRNPPEVAGTAFLVIERPEGIPDQYFYLPALKKVRRIAAGQATDTFMGSDFTFMDLSPIPKDSDQLTTYKRLEDTDVGGQPAYVIEAQIKIPGSPYSKIVTSVHRTQLVPLKIEFFDLFGKPLKVAQIKKLKKIDGKLIPIELEMKNQQKGSSTLLLLKELDLKAKLEEAEFTPEAMVQ